MMNIVYMFLSEPEKIVWKWLTKRNVDFEVQQKMWGGRAEKGGAIIDFILRGLNIALRVMSYWHTIDLEAKARDDMAKERLLSDGWQVVDVCVRRGGIGERRRSRKPAEPG